MASNTGILGDDSMIVEKLPEEINEMKIKDEKEMDTAMVDGNGTETGRIIVTTIGGRQGQPKQASGYFEQEYSNPRYNNEAQGFTVSVNSVKGTPWPYDVFAFCLQPFIPILDDLNIRNRSSFPVQ